MTPTRRTWVQMTLTYVGNAHALLKGGGGKLSLVGGDPGEGRKQTPAG